MNNMKAQRNEEIESDIITPYQMDALREYLGMGVGKAAATLNEMLGRHIELAVPVISIVRVNDIHNDSTLGDSVYSTVTLGFDGNIKGNASIIFDTTSAAQLVDILMPDSAMHKAEMDEISESTLIEVGNIMINSVMGTLSNSFEFELEYQVPRYSESTVLDLCKVNSEDDALIVLFGETFLVVENVEITGKILLFYVLDHLKLLLDEWKEPDGVD